MQEAWKWLSFQTFASCFSLGCSAEAQVRGSRQDQGTETRRKTWGKAYVIDGDTVRVSGQKIRLAGLDAPEVDQVAKHQDGYWFRQGKRVKSALINEIGGKVVSVTVEGYDQYNRVLGTVMHDGRDIGEWLVRNGYAIAAYSERYRHVELDAQRNQRGMWGHAAQYDPRTWRHEIQGDSRSG